MSDASQPPQTRTATRNSRYSIISNTNTMLSSDSATAEIQHIGESIDRLNTHAKKLTDQRVELNEEQRINLQKLALGAKLERALDRRMSSQDAVMRPRKRAATSPLSEKEGEKVAAAAA